MKYEEIAEKFKHRKAKSTVERMMLEKEIAKEIQQAQGVFSIYDIFATLKLLNPQFDNHREAVTKQFHHNGNSAVMVLPTGAGKTTVSCLKIASVLGSDKSVVFIAPTHALVEQLTVDLQVIFPEKLFGSLVSSDFDRLFAVGTSLRKIEVMTPEHCLALLSYAPEVFN